MYSFQVACSADLKEHIVRKLIKLFMKVLYRDKPTVSFGEDIMFCFLQIPVW